MMKKKTTRKPKSPRKWPVSKPHQPTVVTWRSLTLDFIFSVVAYCALYPRRFTIYCILCILSCFFSKFRHNWAYTAFVWVWKYDDFFDNTTTIVGDDNVPFLRETGFNPACVPASVAGSIATMINKNTGKKIVLSRQVLSDWLDVNSDHSDYEGAYTEDAFEYAELYGLPEEHVYPFEGVPKLFYKRVKKGIRYRIAGYDNIWSLDFQSILTRQIIATTFIVDGYEHHTGRGIFESNFKIADYDPNDKSGAVPHSVHIIGHGRENGVSFFIVAEVGGLHWGFWGIGKVRCDLFCQFQAPVWPGKDNYMVFF